MRNPRKNKKRAAIKAERVYNRQLEMGFSRDEAAFCTALMYPEFLRSGFLRNRAEMLFAILSVLLTGSHNYSVGDIQMRPSLTRNIEKYIRETDMEEKYPGLCCREEGNSRRSQIKHTLRLLRRDTEILYVRGFVELYRCICMENKILDRETALFADELLLRRFEIAYTCGLKREESVMEYQMEARNFPRGTNHRQSYGNFSQIAAAWWREKRASWAAGG